MEETDVVPCDCVISVLWITRCKPSSFAQRAWSATSSLWLRTMYFAPPISCMETAIQIKSPASSLRQTIRPQRPSDADQKTTILELDRRKTTWKDVKGGFRRYSPTVLPKLNRCKTAHRLVYTKLAVNL